MHVSYSIFLVISEEIESSVRLSQCILTIALLQVLNMWGD